MRVDSAVIDIKRITEMNCMRINAAHVIVYSYFMPVWWIVKSMSRGAVDSPMQYFPRPQVRGQ